MTLFKVLGHFKKGKPVLCVVNTFELKTYMFLWAFFGKENWLGKVGNASRAC